MKKSLKHFFENNFFTRTIFKHYNLSVFLFLILPTAVFLFYILLSGDLFQTTSSKNILISKKNVATIVIDAGHGGRDPGKVGTKGTLEKDINLKIALYLKDILESQNIHVILTREEDMDLAKGAASFKTSDMKERIALIQKSNADAVISIHQNSYTDSDICGAQCFYYTPSETGKSLAGFLQKQIVTSTNQSKIREIKGNDDYYLLKKSSIPTVIVECGFLSNPEDEQLLLQEEYQRKMAWAIHLGILNYLNS